MSVPPDVRAQIRAELWAEADRVGWSHLSPSTKAQYYENWTRDPRFGGKLEAYVSTSRVRIYLKNSILGGYGRARLSDEDRPLRILRIAEDTTIVERYRKPHGARFEDGRVVAWGRATSWRAILLAVHERAYVVEGATPRGVVLFRATGRYREDATRRMIEDAAAKLGLREVAWLEG
jgi:hypothetical protein